MKKKNMLKRNSGFVAASILAAGASFFTANTILSELRPGSISVQPESESTGSITERDTTGETGYETNSFTITANGTIVNQVESEALKASVKETNADGTLAAETNADGTPASENNGNGSQAGTNQSADDLSGETTPNGTAASDDTNQTGTSSDSGENADNSGGSGSSAQDTGSGSDGSYVDNSYSDNSYGDGSSDGGSDVSIVPDGNNYYYDSGNYEDGSQDGSSSGGGYSDGSSGGGSYGSGIYEGTYSDSSIYSPDDLILWHVNSRYIGEEELYNFDAATIRLLRNELFALHGRMFTSEDLQSYFSQKSWYVPTYDPDTFDSNMESYLNDYELANLHVILAYEAALNG